MTQSERLVGPRRNELLRHMARIADLQQRAHHGGIIHFLRVVEFRATGHAGGVDVSDDFAVLAQTAVDCVLLDYSMPDMDAPELLAALCQGSDLPPCPVVVITGTEGEDGLSLLGAGAQDYIGKRWTSAESLTRAVENAVERFAMTIAGGVDIPITGTVGELDMNADIQSNLA